jgi:ketosteroid isomerase-like protein
MDQRNEDVAQDFLDAYGRRDFQTLEKLLTDDVLWHVGGNHPLSGDYRGRQAVLDYFERVQTLTSQTLTLEPIEILSGGNFGAIFLRVRAEREGRGLDVTMAEAFRAKEGQLAEFWATSDDQEAVDRFWS